MEEKDLRNLEVLHFLFATVRYTEVNNDLKFSDTFFLSQSLLIIPIHFSSHDPRTRTIIETPIAFEFLVVFSLQMISADGVGLCFGPSLVVIRLPTTEAIGWCADMPFNQR